MNGEEERLSPEEIEVNDLLDKTFEDIEYLNQQMEQPYEYRGAPAPGYNPPGAVPPNHETVQQRLERLKNQKLQVSQHARDNFLNITKDLSPGARKKIETKAISRIKIKLADNRSKRLEAERQRAKPLSRSQGVMQQLKEVYKETQQRDQSRPTGMDSASNGDAGAGEVNQPT
jgi:hypothetical protein